METTENKISTEDLRSIMDARANAAYMQVLAEKAVAEKVIAELQVKNITLMAYLKYGLSSSDSIENDGHIVRVQQDETSLTPPTASQVKSKKTKTQ